MLVYQRVITGPPNQIVESKAKFQGELCMVLVNKGATHMMDFLFKLMSHTIS
jgi:hypothetical protein